MNEITYINENSIKKLRKNLEEFDASQVMDNIGHGIKKIFASPYQNQHFLKMGQNMYNVGHQFHGIHTRWR